jgi:hypothetical protein
LWCQQRETKEVKMATTIGQVTTGGLYHLNLHGLAACGSGAGRIHKNTIIPATSADAWGKVCKRCQRGLRRDVTVAEAQTAAPKGMRINQTNAGILITSAALDGWNAAAPTAWNALLAARLRRGEQIRAAQAAKAARATREAGRSAAAAHHCRECGKRLQWEEYGATNMPGHCFNCA